MQLAKWQRAFAEALETDAPHAVLLESLASGHAVPPELAVQIYRSNTRGARRKALLAAYPVCEHVVGTPCFAAMARDFVAATPSLQADINVYGAEFARFVEGLLHTREDFAALPWLADLASLEWARQVAHYAVDDVRQDPQVLHDHANPGSLVPRLASSVTLLESAWPMDVVWQDHQPGHEPSPIGPESVRLVVFRSSGNVVSSRLSTIVWEFLRDCRDGVTLAEFGRQRRLDSELIPELIGMGIVVGFAEGQHDAG